MFSIAFFLFLVLCVFAWVFIVRACVPLAVLYVFARILSGMCAVELASAHSAQNPWLCYLDDLTLAILWLVNITNLSLL